MSPRSETVTPQPDREAISPSPARNALQSNLESGLTLTRKRSWFGSAREWASKGAHHAKGYFDKHDSVKADSRGRQLTLDRPQGDELLSPEAECSDEDTSTTPFKPTPLRHRTFTPKTAMASLRQHTQSARGKHKRGTLTDVHKLEEDSLPDGDQTSTPADDALKGHAQKSSVAKSLVGSIRGISRKAAAASTTSPEKLVEQRESTSSAEDAAFVPLPSSPINITPLPTLSLDLPPSALVPDSFGRTPPDSDTELMRLTNPINITGARPVPTYYTRIPGEGPVDQLNLAFGLSDKTFAPRDYLGIQADSLRPVPNLGPSTPMPGTNCSLELDGISLPRNETGALVQEPPHRGHAKLTGTDGANDETELFERNVEYKDEIKKKENRTLKKMVSLDAMAEECAALTPSQGTNPALRNVSDVTIKECPDDMPRLTRQWAHLQTPSAGHRCPQTGDWKSEDPFAPGNAVGDLAVDGPPAVGAQVILPLRPKITLQSADSAEPRTLNDNDIPILADRMGDTSTTAARATATTDKPQVCEWSDIEMPSHNNPSFVPETASVSSQKMPPVEATGGLDNLEEESAVRPQTPLAKGAASEQRVPSTATDIVCDPLGLDEMIRTNAAKGVDNEKEHIAHEQSIDGSDQDSMHGSLHQKSSVMQIYELLTKTHTPSPKRMITGIAVSNSASAFWKFKPWNTSPHGARQTEQDTCNGSDGAARDAPLRSRRRSSDLDVEPSESGWSPGARSTTSTLDVGSSPSMGDRVKFDVERASRAERYTALADHSNRGGGYDAVVFEDMDSSQAPSPLRPVRNDSPSAPKAEQDPETDAAEPRSRRNSASGSRYSIDSDLQADLAGVYELQNAMAGTSFDPNPIMAEGAIPATPMPYGGDDPPRTSEYVASSPLEDIPALSPGEKKFWRDVQDCPFGTPQQTPGESPTQSLHQRQSTAILSATPCAEDPDEADDERVDGALSPDEEASADEVLDDAVHSTPEQTLDEGLELYHSFTSNPDMRYSDTSTIPDQDSPAKNPFASPDSGYQPDGSSDVEELASSPSEQRRGGKTMITNPMQ